MTEGWTLQIRPEPPTCMFANHHYRSHVYLLDSGNQLVTGVSFGLTVRLLHEDGSIASDRIMHLNSRNLSINKQGNAQFSYHFEDTSLLHGNKRFKLQVKGKGTHAFLPPAISTPIRVIRYQLQVCNSLPTEWFKDQGGRDKHMSLDVQLQDFTRQPVSIPENIPLVVSLVYEKTGAQPHPTLHLNKVLENIRFFTCLLSVTYFVSLFMFFSTAREQPKDSQAYEPHKAFCQQKWTCQNPFSNRRGVQQSPATKIQNLRRPRY